MTRDKYRWSSMKDQTEKSQKLVDAFREKAHKKQSFDPTLLISKSLWGSATKLIAGTDIGDEIVKGMREAVDGLVQYQSFWEKFTTLVPFTLLQRYFYRRAIKSFSIRDQLLRPFVEQQFSSSQPTANASNYIDLVGQKRNRSAENGKKMQSYFDSENIQYIASKLIAAGGIGSLSNLMVAFSQMVSHPEWEEKLHREASVSPTAPLASEIRTSGR
eukprot:18813_1